MLDGKIRGGISNRPQLSQSLVEKMLFTPSLADERVFEATHRSAEGLREAGTGGG